MTLDTGGAQSSMHVLTRTMDNYRLPNLLIPEYLYRVDYFGSRTTYSETEGLVAADRSKVYNFQDIDAFKSDIVRQFTWGNRKPLPFISLFSDEYHAANWGLKQPWKNYTAHHLSAEWTVRSVHTDLLSEPCIFKLEDLVDGLRLTVPEEALQHIEGAYLCLHNIPAAAIHAHWNSQEAKEGMVDKLSKVSA